MDPIETNLHQASNARNLGPAAARQQAEATFPPAPLYRREDNARGTVPRVDYILWLGWIGFYSCVSLLEAVSAHCSGFGIAIASAFPDPATELL
jgi:hypothetical protein